MQDIEQIIRDRAYRLWVEVAAQTGMPKLTGLRHNERF